MIAPEGGLGPGGGGAGRADLVDHQLNRLGLAHRRHRTGLPRERERELRRANRFGGDETRLGDRDRGLDTRE